MSMRMKSRGPIYNVIIDHLFFCILVATHEATLSSVSIAFSCWLHASRSKLSWAIKISSTKKIFLNSLVETRPVRLEKTYSQRYLSLALSVVVYLHRRRPLMISYFWEKKFCKMAESIRCLQLAFYRPLTGEYEFRCVFSVVIFDCYSLTLIQESITNRTLFFFSFIN